MPYSVILEVSAPLAMFARPDTGATPTSYPAPPWSAAKGLFESIAMFSDGAAYFSPTKIEICKRIGTEGGVNFQRYTTSYGGPLRKASLLRGQNGMQLIATVLSNVCYRLHAEVKSAARQRGANPAHHLHDLFMRRLKRGQCFRTPALGWREFTCDYWGHARDDFEIDKSINMLVPSMMHSVWSEACNGAYAPHFVQDARIVEGVLVYAQ
jgi:CRISPR-associated protein Cas5d